MVGCLRETVFFEHPKKNEHENDESHQTCDFYNDGIEFLVVLDKEEVGF